LALSPHRAGSGVRVGVHLTLEERLERRRLIRELAQLRLRILLTKDLGVGRALLRGDALAGEVVALLDGAPFFTRN